MQKRYIGLILAAALVAVIFLPAQAAGISDFGSPCKRNVDCATGLCSNGICSTEGPCANLELDNGETDVDCGGVCVEVKRQTCALGKRCVENYDCASGACSSGGRCVSQSEVKAQNAAKAKSSAPGSSFAAKATIFLIIVAIVIFAVAALLSFLKRRVTGKLEDDLPPLRHTPGGKTLPSQPPQRTQEQPVHRSPHAVFEELERTYSDLSGEELFEQLRKKTGKR